MISHPAFVAPSNGTWRIPNGSNAFNRANIGGRGWGYRAMKATVRTNVMINAEITLLVTTEYLVGFCFWLARRNLFHPEHQNQLTGISWFRFFRAS